jgi:uncharacterized HAD superfamily protein
MEHKGLRYNKGKLRYDLVHPDAHQEMVKVLTMGAEKYAERNWEKGMKWSNIIASLKRHIAAIEMGEDYDAESGLLHAAHVACNAHFLTAYYKIYPQGDDRPHSYLNSLKIGLDIDGVLADFDLHLCNTVGIDLHNITHWNDPIIKKHYEAIKHDENFWLTMPTLIKPEDIPFEPHVYITSRSIDSKITKKWLHDNGFPDAPVHSIGTNESKVDTAIKSNIDIFIDDKWQNFIELNASGICTFLMDAPHNRKYNVGYKRIFNFDNFK